jgi:hypothetical protein
MMKRKNTRWETAQANRKSASGAPGSLDTSRSPAERDALRAKEHKKTIGATALREQALLKILATANLTNECGQAVTSFQNYNRDGLDFMSISKNALQEMLNAAYIAGRQNGKVYPYSGE